MRVSRRVGELVSERAGRARSENTPRLNEGRRVEVEHPDGYTTSTPGYGLFLRCRQIILARRSHGNCTNPVTGLFRCPAI